MGQHPSSESVNRSGNADATTIPRYRNGFNGDMVASEDDTMVDVSSASSMASNRGRQSLLQNFHNTRMLPQRARPTTSSNSTRPTRRSSLWCRVQSLRNRIYRTTRRIIVNNPINAQNVATIPSSSTSSPGPSPSRRNPFGDPVIRPASSRRRSGIFGTPSSQPPATRPRPLSFAGPDPFIHNIDPRFDPVNDRRPRTSHATHLESSRHRSSSQRRSIWGVSSSSRPATATNIPATTPTLPPVIDHSTQTSAINHPVQPFNITRRPGEDQAEMLSRFLYVAGAALAASLVGSTDSTTAQLQDFSADFADATDDDLANAPEGSFEGFLRALRQGRSQFAHALRNDSEPSSSGEGAGSAFTYLLMYRFNSLTTPITTNRATTPVETPTTETTLETAMVVESRPPTPMPSSGSELSTSRTNSISGEPRMIPFVIIGVQPVPPRDSQHAGVPSFSEGVASLLANARQNAGQVRPTTSAGALSSSPGPNPLHSTTSIPTIPGAWRDSPPPERLRRRASIDGSFRHPSTNTTTTTPATRDREQNTRAWQMYIYGGAYPENHLIFTAPTLFTDVFRFFEKC